MFLFKTSIYSKYYALNAIYCILGAPTSRLGGAPSAGPALSLRHCEWNHEMRLFSWWTL